MRPCEFHDLGRMDYPTAFEYQRRLVELRKRGDITDQFLIVEHPHVVTMGRNGHAENLLAPPELLERSGIMFHQTDRGGDVTYHGPGQLVGYPILDLREWKRDVGAYVRGIEQAIIDALRVFEISAGRMAAGVDGKNLTGVWVDGAKIAAIGVHISRWITSHGFALNVDVDLNYFRYIVPCGLSLPVTSMHALGSSATRAHVVEALVESFGHNFDLEIRQPVLTEKL